MATLCSKCYAYWGTGTSLQFTPRLPTGKSTTQVKLQVLHLIWYLLFIANFLAVPKRWHPLCMHLARKMLAYTLTLQESFLVGLSVVAWQCGQCPSCKYLVYDFIRKRTLRNYMDRPLQPQKGRTTMYSWISDPVSFGQFPL